MREYICIGLLAHVDAGKTTLSEALLHRTGHDKTGIISASGVRGKNRNSRKSRNSRKG